MKTIITSIIAILFVLSVSGEAWANQIIIGYCNGMIADESQGTITGLSGNNARIHAAIHLTDEKLKDYRVGQVTHLRYGFPEGVTLPSAVTVWVRTAQDGENLQEFTIAPVSGWNDVVLSAPLSLASYDDLWIGMSFLQSRKMSVLSLAGETHPEGCYVAKGSSWRSLSDSQLGSLAIEVVAEDDSFVTRDLALTDVNIPSAFCLHGDDVVVSGKVSNLASTPATAVVRWEMCGITGDCAIDDTLQYRDSRDFELRIPTASLPKGEAELKVELLWADGSEDQNPADNLWSTPVEINTEAATRRMVCEEGTGLWCGWCVSGIVGLDYMTETYPDQFIGIAVHNGDVFTLDDYDRYVAGAMNSGFPGSIINRLTPSKPMAELLEEHYKAMPSYSPYDVAVSAEFPEQSQHDALKAEVVVTATITSLAKVLEHDLRVAIVITEDSLYGMQHNYYSGGSNVMGGFESMPDPVNYPLPHVARTISPSVEGDAEALPEMLEKGVAYEYSRKVSLPKIQYNEQSINFANTHHLTAIALLIDGRNGEILNAAKVGNAFKESDNAITIVPQDVAAEPHYYTLQGCRVSKVQRGFMVSENGKIIIFK